MPEGEQIINFRFLRFRTVSFSVQSLPQEIDEEKINFNVSGNSGAVENMRNRLWILLKVNVSFKEGEGKEVQIGEIETESIFDLESFEVKNTPEGGLTVPQNAMVTFLSLSISTTRGALSTRGAGTLLERSILPVINPGSFLKTVEMKEKV